MKLSDGMLTIKMAVRNIFRYKRRTLITAFAIAFGVMFTIAMDGLLAGSEIESERNIRDYETGEAKIFPDQYFDERNFLPFTFFLEKTDREIIEKALSGYTFTPRSELATEIYFNEDFFPLSGSISAKISAVDPVRDTRVFRTSSMISEGRWLTKGDKGIVIGSWLATDINAKAGYVVSMECRGRGGFYQTFDAEIVGIVTTDNPYINSGSVFMDLSYANDLLALEGAVTEYTLRIKDGLELQKEIAKIKKKLPSYSKNIFSWKEIASDIIQLMRAERGESMIYLILMSIIAAVGISNTMLMSVMERKNEIGMLRALGYSTFRIRSLFVLEGLVIGIFGSGIGLFAGCLINLFMTIWGIDVSSMLQEMDMGYRLTGIMRSAWNIQGIITIVSGSLLISTVMAWFPSGKMLKAEVAEILRK